MAYVFNQNNSDQDKDKDGAQPVQTNSGESSVSAPASASGSSAPANATPENKQNTSSGRFTNLNNYLKANQNYNKDNGGLAGKVVGNVQQQGQQLQNNIQGAQQTFQQQGQNAIGQVNNLNTVQQAVSNPVSVANNADDLAKVQASANASYTGPNSLQDLTGAQNQGTLEAKAQDYSSQVKQGQTESGRFNLLKNMFSRPSYSQGQQTLDNVLIQGNKDQLGALKGANRDVANVNNSLNAANSSAQQQATAFKNQANDIRTQTNDLLNNRVTAENQAIQDRYTQAQQQQTDAMNQFINSLQTDAVAGPQASAFGLTPYMETYNVDPAQYLNKQNLTAQNTATADQYANIAALQKLIGGNASGDVSSILAQYASAPSEQFDPNTAFTLNTPAFQQAVQQAGNAYNTQRQDLDNQRFAYNSYGSGDMTEDKYNTALMQLLNKYRVGNGPVEVPINQAPVGGNPSSGGVVTPRGDLGGGSVR